MVETLNIQSSSATGGGSKEMYWIYDDEDLCWSPGEVVQMKGKEIVVKCIISGNAYEIEKDDALVVHPSCLSKFSSFWNIWILKKLLTAFFLKSKTDGVSDLLELGDFNEGALLHTIRERHSR